MRSVKKLTVLATCLAALTAAGCTAGPYRIRDTANMNNTYYTRGYKKHRDGSVSFTDARTQAKVTLQSSMIEEIPRDEWRGAVQD